MKKVCILLASAAIFVSTTALAQGYPNPHNPNQQNGGNGNGNNGCGNGNGGNDGTGCSNGGNGGNGAGIGIGVGISNSSATSNATAVAGANASSNQTQEQLQGQIATGGEANSNATGGEANSNATGGEANSNATGGNSGGNTLSNVTNYKRAYRTAPMAYAPSVMATECQRSSSFGISTPFGGFSHGRTKGYEFCELLRLRSVAAEMQLNSRFQCALLAQDKRWAKAMKDTGETCILPEPEKIPTTPKAPTPEPERG